MKPSSTTCRQKDMNRTQMTQIERIRRLTNTVNSDLINKINNFLKFCFVIH